MPKPPVPLPGQEYLRECFDYNSESGVLTWRVRPREHFSTRRGFETFNARYPGCPVGALLPFGELQTCLDYIKLRVARIIWKMHYGADPEIVDHIDRDPLNNRLENLRNVTVRQNNWNKVRPASGERLPGVTIIRRVINGRKFMAQIGGPSDHRYLGVFATAEEAHAAYVKAANEMFGEYSPFRVTKQCLAPK